MTFNHITLGEESFSEQAALLQQVGVYCREVPKEDLVEELGEEYGRPQTTRVMLYVPHTGSESWVLEEYLRVDDGDCDGRSRLATARYPKGKRPQLFTTIVDGGQHANSYPTQVQELIRSHSYADRVEFCLNTGKACVKKGVV